MEFVQGRGRYYCDDEQPEAAHNQHLPLIHPIPPSCCSSFTQYSSTRWPPPRQMDSKDDHHPSGSSSGSGCGSSEQHRPQAPFVEKEHMFDKVVTPSDVGKLNRLVIPKQHAEKYFPLDASTNEKGLLLNFEDRTGKPWRFRYSYWNSSQSYVMTKGWSRFVKDKGLDAGDTVSFQRGVGEAGRDRLFIDWRRRPEAHEPPRLRFPLHGHSFYNDPSSMMSFARSVVPWSHLAAPPVAASAVPAMTIYDHHRQLGYGAYNATHASNPYLYLRPAEPPSHVAVQVSGVGRSYGSGGDGAGGSVPVVLESVPVAPSNATAKRVRLFGVDLDSSPSEVDPDGRKIAYETSRLPSLSPPQLSLGSPETVESPGKGKQSMSLDLEM